MSGADRAMPMFPLGRVLLPGELVPLRVFEPRYVTMMRDVLARDRRFGVVLIARGWEVGGGEERTDVGTLAEVTDAAVLGEGQYAVVGVGSKRFRVEEWLPDDPYPMASVIDYPDDRGSFRGGALDELEKRLAKVRALASELGADVGAAEPVSPEEPVEALWQMCSLAPLGELDRQRLLEATSSGRRAQLLTELVDEVIDELTLRLGEG